MMMKCTVENYCHCNCSFWHLNVSVWTCKKIIEVFLYGALIVSTKRALLRTFYTPFVLSINSSILFEYPHNAHTIFRRRPSSVQNEVPFFSLQEEPI
jgi:hypothetical protein